MNLSQTLEKIGFFVLLATVFLFPFFFLPVTSEYYEFNKNFLLLAASGSLFIILTLQFVMDKQVKLTHSPLALPIVLSTLASVISAVSVSPNRLEAFLQPGQTGTMLSLGLLFFTGTSFIKNKKQLAWFFYTMFVSIGLLATISIVWSTGLASKVLPESLAYLKNSLWSPTGSIIATLIILVSSLPLQIVATVRSKAKETALAAIVLFVTLLGIGAIVYNFVNPPTPGAVIPLLSHSSGWSIAMDALKISPLLGTGPATFLTNFTRFRPLSYNLSPNWSLRFVNSSSYWLEILSTLGILGFASWLLLFLRSILLTRKTLRLSASSTASPEQTYALASSLSLILLLVMLMLLPGNLITLFMVFVYLILAVSAFKQLGTNLVYEANVDLVATNNSNRSALLPLLLFVLSVLLLAPTTYFAVRAYTAEVWFASALKAANKNDGKTTYQSLIKAIQINPYADGYHVAYSQTNLLLANSLASKQNLSEADRNTITQLVQQAIQEGKNAVALNPTKVTNVENLANIYRTLLNFAQGADAWAIAAYSQAATLDPINPNYRIALGGIYYSLKNYDQAIQLFQQAVNLKPDFANAHYNLAEAYIQKGDLSSGVTSLQATLNLLEPASADYQKVADELTQTKQKLGQTTPPSTQKQAESTLTKPQPIQPVVNPPLKLDESLSPSATPIPTPSPVPSPTTNP